MGKSLPSESLGSMLDAIAKQGALQEVVAGSGPPSTRQEDCRCASPKKLVG